MRYIDMRFGEMRGHILMLLLAFHLMLQRSSTKRKWSHLPWLAMIDAGASKPTAEKSMTDTRSLSMSGSFQ